MKAERDEGSDLSETISFKLMSDDTVQLKIYDMDVSASARVDILGSGDLATITITYQKPISR